MYARAMKNLYLLAPLLLAACGAPPPPSSSGGDTADAGPCLRCSQGMTRQDEARLCPDTFSKTWEPLHQCRCAPSSPCVAACPIWCAGGAIEQSCAGCSSMACSAELASCEADKP